MINNLLFLIPDNYDVKFVPFFDGILSFDRILSIDFDECKFPSNF